MICESFVNYTVKDGGDLFKGDVLEIGFGVKEHT